MKLFQNAEYFHFFFPLNVLQIVLAFDDDLFPHTGYSTYSDDHMICARGPAGLVTNKKNKAFIEKWNVGLEKIKGNGELRKICDDYGNYFTHFSKKTERIFVFMEDKSTIVERFNKF